jgi:hypothetical protein
VILRSKVEGARASVSVTGRAVTLALGDELVAAWDRGGRLYSFWEEGCTYRTGLNGRALAKWREHGRRQRRWLSPAEWAGLLDRAAGLATRFLSSFAGDGEADSRDTAAAVRSPRDDVGILLARAARFDSAAAVADAAAFRGVYSPIGILPPDQYLSLVLQATVGCSFGSCTFCDFYGNPYRVKTAPEFEEHARRVREYLGDSLSLRNRSVFLGSANALAIPMSGLLPVFEILRGELPGRPVCAFLDGFAGAFKSVSDYRALGERGLRRVYVGLESGDDTLLEFVNKPSTSAQTIATVRAIKRAGVQVGVIVMIGLGGDAFMEPHARETARALEAMSLGERDLLYFSELVDAGSPYRSDAERSKIRPLDAVQVAQQRRAIEQSAGFGAARPRIASYDVREFVY